MFVWYIPLIHQSKEKDMITTVEVRHLIVGDELSGGCVVTTAPWEDTSTPKGKMYINVKYPKEKEGGFTRTWGKYTKVGVKNR